MWFLIAIIAFFIIIIYINVLVTRAKRTRLLEKYGDPALVGRLMRGRFWVDMTQGQLLDSIGRPVHIDQKVLKTKTKEIWKYQKTGTNRFALRITVENKIVVGWDDKR